MNSIPHPSAAYIGRLKETLSILDSDKLVMLAEKLRGLQGSERMLFLAGNGGSAATASHATCDLGKTITKNGTRPGIRAVSLNDNIPALSAWGNDAGYEYVFSGQLKNLARKGDFCILISASGNSANILEAAKAARELGVETFGLLGFDGGKAKDLLDDYLLVRVDDYGIVEDAHMMIFHAITDALKK
jgi:D-sedoheptulose 7-phosphate isomerase